MLINVYQINDDRNNPSILFKLDKPQVGFLGTEDEWTEYFKSKELDPTGLTLKKVHFPKQCVYPRSKLSNTDIKRSLKPEKADAVIFSDITDTYTMTGFLYHDPGTNNYYHIPYYGCYQYSSIKINATSKEDAVIEYCKQKGVVPNTVVYVQGGTVRVSRDSVKEEFLLKLDSYPNIMHTSTFDAYISPNLASASDDMLLNIEEMLNSSDNGTVGLAVELLSGMNVSENRMSVGMILQKHIQKVIRAKKHKSVIFIGLLKSLNIKMYDIEYGGRINLFTKLSKDATSKKDILFGIRYVEEYVKETLDDHIKHLTENFKKLDLKIKYEYTHKYSEGTDQCDSTDRN